MENILIAAHYGLIDTVPFESKNFNVICPFHDDREPSLTMYQSYFKCWACGEAGTLNQFIIKYEELSGNKINRWEAILLLAKMKKFSEIKIIRTEKDEKSKEELREYAHSFISSLGRPCWKHLQHHYLLDRKYTPKILDEHGVRINTGSSHSIVLPIYENGVFQGYISRRSVDDRLINPKYKNNHGFDREAHIGGTITKGAVLVVEGYLDYLRACQYGWSNVCVTFGAYCSEKQANIIKQHATSIVCGYDNDNAGRIGSRLLRSRFTEIPFYEFPFQDNIKDIGEMSYQQFKSSEYNIGR